MSGPRPHVPMRAPRAAMFAAVCVALAAVGHVHMSGRGIPLPWLLAAFAATAALAWTAAGRRRGPLGITAALLSAQAALHVTFSAAQGPQAAHHRHRPLPGTGPPGPMDAAGTGTAHASGLADAAGTAHAAGAHDPAAMAHAAGLADLTGMVHAHGAAPAPGTADGMASAATAMADGMASAHAAADGMAAGMTAATADGMAAATADGMSTGMGGLAGLAAMAGHGGFGMVAAHLLAGVLCALWLARGEAAVFRLAGVIGATALLAARPLARVLVLLRTRVAPVPAPPAQRLPCHRPRRLRGAVHAHTAVRRGPPRRRDTRTTAPWPLPARAT
ncbi:hypothetical protein ABZ743_12705 [Streptomyces sp. NPDC006662]|uniref:hypothetical protein n=1 Tax=Streptomyces sp. NPDC006662 TaxID=3156902 RepID=UPI0033E8268A